MMPKVKHKMAMKPVSDSNKGSGNNNAKIDLELMKTNKVVKFLE